jgi:hypothetical protein
MRERVWSGAFWLLGLSAAIAAFVSFRISSRSWILVGMFVLLSVWCFGVSGYLSGAWAAFLDIRDDWLRSDDDDDSGGPCPV